MSSVDGRLLNDRWTPPFDGTPASKPLEVYAALGRELNTDAWMFGKIHSVPCSLINGA